MLRDVWHPLSHIGYALQLSAVVWGVRAMDVRVYVAWDPEAEVWVAESDDVPGLVTEAPTVEAMLTKLRVLIPELMELNGVPLPGDGDGFPYSLIARDWARGSHA